VVTRLRAVPSTVWTAVGALAFLASTGLAVVLGAGFHVWGGGQAPAPTALLVGGHGRSAVVTVPGHAPAKPTGVPSVPAGPASVPVTIHGSGNGATAGAGGSGSGAAPSTPPAARGGGTGVRAGGQPLQGIRQSLRGGTPVRIVGGILRSVAKAERIEAEVARDGEHAARIHHHVAKHHAKHHARKQHGHHRHSHDARKHHGHHHGDHD